MTVPSKLDIKKREDKLKGFLKKLDKDGKPQEKHVVSVVRSAIRQAWMKSDVKLAYLYSKTIPDLDDSTRTKWLVRCEICEGLFKLSDVEIDHKYVGGSSFTKASDFESYFENILMVGFDDLQILCKDGCHRTKTLSESLKISFSQAEIERDVIKIMKMKAKDVDLWLKERNIVVAKNSLSRRNAVREVLQNEKL